MKIVSDILVLFALCAAIVEGSWLAATANKLIEPIILSTGAAILSAINSNDNIDMKGWFKHNIFSREKEDGQD